MSAKPLRGITVIVTRPREQSGDLIRGLVEAGGRAIAAPSIRIASPASYAGLDRALRRLRNFDALVFTSQNAVRWFFRRARRLGLRGLKPPAGLYAVGPATAAALKARGWQGARAPKTHRGEALARVVAVERGARVLIPRAAQAREDLPRLLRRRGVRVTLVEAYRAVPDGAAASRLSRAAARGGVDAVCFASGSAVDALFEQLGPAAAKRLFQRAIAAAIGPVTAGALRARGLKPAIVAREATTAGLLSALKAHFRKRRAAP